MVANMIQSDWELFRLKSIFLQPQVTYPNQKFGELRESIHSQTLVTPVVHHVDQLIVNCRPLLGTVYLM